MLFLFFFRVNQALLFDGEDDHVTLPSIHSLGLTDRYINRALPFNLERFAIFHPHFFHLVTNVFSMHLLCLAALL